MLNGLQGIAIAGQVEGNHIIDEANTYSIWCYVVTS